MVCSVVGGVVSTTLGDSTRGILDGAVDTLGSLEGAGYSVARFKICASCIYALVTLDPYSSEGILFFGSLKMTSKSEAVCRR